MEKQQPRSDDEPIERIRFKLNKERVKLWQPPYTQENGQKGEIPVEMVQRYASDLNMEENAVSSILEQLRVHSVEKLAARRRRSETGIANLNIRVTGKMTVERAEFPLEVTMLIKGQELREQVANMSGIPMNRLKLIGCGHVIVDDRTLYEQHIRPDSQIMAIVLSETEASQQAEENERRRLEEARKDAEILSNQSWG